MPELIPAELGSPEWLAARRVGEPITDEPTHDLAAHATAGRRHELIRADQESINAAMGWPPDE